MREHWSLSQFLASEIVQGLAPSDEVSYQRFGEQFKQSLPASSGRKAILASIASTELPFGTTRLLDTIAEAVVQASLAKDDAIVVITDSWDTSSKVQTSPLTTQLLQRRLRLFAVLVVDMERKRRGLPLYPSEAHAINRFQEVTETTGGLLIWPQQAGIHLVGEPQHPDDALEKNLCSAPGPDQCDRPT